MSTATRAWVEIPVDDASTRHEALAYLEAYDAVNDDDYAFLACREIDRATGNWQVRIKARAMSGAVLDPEQIRKAARTAEAQQKPYFTWGAGVEPSPGDPRQVEFRVHVADGKPSEVEIFVVLRQFDHTAAKPQAVRFPWPAPA